VPGPAFAFATFTGGMALKGWGFYFQLLGCFIATVGIFLPSILLIFFIHPFWQYLKSYRFIKRSLEGVSAAATGLVLGAAVVLYANLQFLWINIAVVVSAFLLLMFTKIQPPILVALGLLAGFIYSKLAA
jgi:chromate transporter